MQEVYGEDDPFLFDAFVCANFSTESLARSTYAPFMYDAVYAVAHALDELFEVQGKTYTAGTLLRDTLLNRVGFQGTPQSQHRQNQRPRSELL